MTVRIICAFTRYYLGYQVKEDGICGTYSANERGIKYIKV
jgi:hypothetical protein